MQVWCHCGEPLWETPPVTPRGACEYFACDPSAKGLYGPRVFSCPGCGRVLWTGDMHLLRPQCGREHVPREEAPRDLSL